MTTARGIAIAAVLSLSLTAPALAAEEIVEHETYEKRSMKVETVPVTPSTTLPAPNRVYEHHDESESKTVERRSIPPPAVIVKERTTDSIETHEKN